jgi:anti-sigma B factor antagonist
MSARPFLAQGERMTHPPTKAVAAEFGVTSWPRRHRSGPAALVPGALEVSVADCSEAGASVALVGELDVAHAPHVARVLRMLADRGCDAAVDVSALRFIDAAGVATLLNARAHAEARGHRLVLVSPSAAVVRMLELTATQDLLPVRSADPVRRTSSRSGQGIGVRAAGGGTST